MNRTVITSMLALGIALVFFACKNESTTAPDGTARIRGKVLDAARNPLAGVTITPTPNPKSDQPPTFTTTSTGDFDFSFNTSSSLTVRLQFQKSTYRDTALVVEIVSKQDTTVEMKMTSSTLISGGTTSGHPASIYLVGASPTDLSVYGVGGNETSYLTWEVRDSVGLPIDAAHAVTVSFSNTGGLNGGEFIYPVSVLTNAQGRATTSLNSGIVSGALQVVATIPVQPNSNHTIVSQPVQIVIHSGLPHQAHFSVGPLRHNFPALHILGKRDNISVLVGDMYSNPVATHTAVYFASRAGVILSSVFTTPSGEGTVDLISGNPYPLGTYATTPYGEGYHYLSASTIGQGGTIVRDSTLLLWTGYSVIDSISPGTFNIPNGGGIDIFFKVSDEYGHTLSAPTVITASVEGSQAKVLFGIAGTYTIGQDVILPVGALTHFSCFVTDSAPDTTYSSPATLSISVVSENGNVIRSISGTMH